MPHIATPLGVSEESSAAAKVATNRFSWDLEGVLSVEFISLPWPESLPPLLSACLLFVFGLGGTFGARFLFEFDMSGGRGFGGRGGLVAADADDDDDPPSTLSLDSDLLWAPLPAEEGVVSRLEGVPGDAVAEGIKLIGLLVVLGGCLLEASGDTEKV